MTKPYTDEQVRAGADALVRLRTQAPSLDGLEAAERDYWLRDARAVLEAAGMPTGTCPCTCHQPDRCPCKLGAPKHKHGAGGWCTVSDPVPADALPVRDHVVTFHADGTWTLAHPADCADFPDCKVRQLAERQVTSDLAQLVAGGRYTCSAGDLGDVFQLGERLHDDQCTTPVCAACGCWCHAEEQTEG
jgi:hypothetical protein